MEAKVILRGKQPEKNQQNVNLNKYRRIQTMQKKCAEISSQCNVDVVCIIYDRKFNRFREIRTAQEMTLEKVHDMMSQRRSPNEKLPKYQKILVSYQQAGEIEAEELGSSHLDTQLEIPKLIDEKVLRTKNVEATSEKYLSQREVSPEATGEIIDELKQIASKKLLGQKRRISSYTLDSSTQSNNKLSASLTTQDSPIIQITESNPHINLEESGVNIIKKHRTIKEVLHEHKESLW